MIYIKIRALVLITKNTETNICPLHLYSNINIYKIDEEFLSSVMFVSLILKASRQTRRNHLKSVPFLWHSA